jgi:hypothetical protein
LRNERHQHCGREGFGQRCEAEGRAGSCLDILLAICEPKTFLPNEVAFVDDSDGDAGGPDGCNLLENPLSHRSKVVLLTVSCG